MKSPVCGAPLKGKRCDYCGYEDRMPVEKDISLNQIYCQKEELPGQHVIMDNPVFKSPEVAPGVSRKSKTVALLLCIFGGGLGAHKFYVGKSGMGILYLFTLGLFGFGWIIDIILIATGMFKDEFDLPLL